jgi:hypothetical protein
MALRALVGWEQAGEVHIQAQRMKADTSCPMHEMWLALDAALTGNAEEARQCLAILRPGKLDKEPSYVWLRSLIEAALDDAAEAREKPLDVLRLEMPGAATKKEAWIPLAVLCASLDRVSSHITERHEEPTMAAVAATSNGQG